MGIAVVGETPSLSGESIGDAHGILECTQAQPPRNQYLKVHYPLVGSEGSGGKWGESLARSQSALFPI